MVHPSDEIPQPRLDPTYLHARREALFVVGLWALCLLWAVPYCYFTGYPGPDFDPAQLQTVWGIPRWVFFGVVVPWLVADVVTAWFCFRFMQYDDLGPAHEGADLQSDLAEPRDSEETA
jgi:fatty acid desaturase